MVGPNSKIREIFIGDKMRALFYNFSKKKFVLKEISIPKIKAGELLVRVKVSALCGSDLHMIDGSLTPKVYNKKEIILGHSFSGIVSKIGKKIRNFKIGDRVFTSNFVWCGKCKRCREGDENLCDDRYIFGMEIPGAHAEYIKVPERVLFRLPQRISFLDGAQITDVLTVDWHAFKKVNLKSGDKVVIFGCGPIGLAMGILLKSFKINSIFVVEPNKSRQILAKKLFGARIIDKKKLAKFNGQFDIAFEASGSVKAMDWGFKFLKRGGKMAVIGVHSKNFNLNSLKLVSRELSLFGIFHYTSTDIRESLKLIKEKKLDLKKIITHRFFLKDGEKA